MYNILELKDKDLDELQSIAREMSLESTSFSNKDELVYLGQLPNLPPGGWYCEPENTARGGTGR